MRRHDCSMAKRFDPYDFIIRLEAQILGIEPVICRTLNFLSEERGWKNYVRQTSANMLEI